MSWLLGMYRPGLTKRESAGISSFVPHPLHRVTTRDGLIFAGGLAETCLAGGTGDGRKSEGWLVVGCGLSISSGAARVLGRPDWAKILSLEQPDLTALDGHFAIVRWVPGGIQLSCDQLGLRTLYFTQIEDGLAFSTRLDWLARFSGKNRLDYRALGSRWTTFHQLGYGSGVEGILRLSPGGVASFSSDGLRVTARPWLPSLTPVSPEECAAHLLVLADPRPTNGAPLSLGLSGGVDSRLLLAIRYLRYGSKVVVHTFGDPVDPDVRLPLTIARDLRLNAVFYHEPLPPPETLVPHVQAYVAETMLVEPASSSSKLRYYPKIRMAGRFLIDGGFGELARRQYFNRLRRFGISALRRGDPDGIRRLISVRRPVILENQIVGMMVEGVREDIAAQIRSMPSVSEIGVENFLDLLAVRTRIPNYGGPEQGRLDATVPNLMPLAQPSHLRRVFGLPLALRRNARFSRRWITSYVPELARYGFVKAGSAYPSWMPPGGAVLYTSLRRKAGLLFIDPSREEFLSTLRELVQDLAHSASTQNFSGYEQGAVVRLVDAYYEGHRELAADVDWWLCFEMWRRALTGAGLR